MANDEKISKMYDALVKSGYNMAPEDVFRQRMNDPAKRRAAYDALRKSGYNMRPYDEFEANIGYGKGEATTASAPASAASATTKADTAQEQAAQVSPTDAPGKADSAAPQGGWQPTAKEKAAISFQLQTMMNDFNQRSRERVEQTRRMSEGFTPEGREKQKAAGTRAQIAGTPTRVAGVTPYAPAEDDLQRGAAETSPVRTGGIGRIAHAAGETVRKMTDAVKPKQSGQSPLPYGVVIENGERKTQWLLPDGSLTTDIVEADKAEYGARRVRLMNRFAGRMKANGLDPARQEDVQLQSAIDAVDSGIGMDAAQRQEIVSAMEREGLDPKNQEHVKWGILQYRLEESERRLSELNRRKEEETRAKAEEGEKKKPGFRDLLTHGSDYGVTNSFAHGAGQIPAPHASVSGAAQSKVDKEIEQATAEVATLRKMLSEYHQKTRADKKGWFGKVLQGLLDGATSPSSWTMGMYDLSLNHTIRNADSSTEAGRRLLESSQMPERLHAQTPDPGGFYSGGYFAGEMLADPITYVASGAGSAAQGMVARGLAGRAGKHLSKKGAERLAMNSLTNRLVSSGAGMGVNLTAFEGLRDMRQQTVDGGWTDSNGDFHEGFSMWHSIKQGGHGLILGTTMGVFGAGIGNVGNWAVRQTGNVAGKAGVRAGQHVISMVGEGTIFAMPDIMEFHTMGDERFDKLYAGKFGYADEDDPAARNSARDAARNSLTWDAWSDSQAMVFGMKVAGKATHAVNTVSSVKSTLKSLRRRGERDHVSFAEKVSQMLDSSPLDITLTKEEREELRENGYGGLGDLFVRSGKPAAPGEARPEERAVDFPYVKAEEVGKNRELDGYEAMERLMQDKNVSQATRAKAYFILTGRMLPMGTVAGYTTQKNKDGGVTVNSVTADGEVVTSRVFANERASQGEINNIRRQVELNTIDVGERYAVQAVNLVTMDEVKDMVASRHRIPARAVENIYMKHFKGEELSGAELEIVNEVNAFAAQVSGKYRHLSPEAMREEVKARFGVEVDDALRKAGEKRTDAEREAVREYATLLFEEAERQRRANSLFDEQYAEMRAEEKEQRRRAWRMQMEGKLLDHDPKVQAEADRRYEESHRVYERHEQGDPTAQADIDAIVLRMHEAYEMCEDAFGTEAEYRMYQLNENPWALVNDPALTPDQAEAVLYYINSKAALDGVMDASHEASRRKREQVEQEVAGRTHKERGVIIPAVLKVDDKPVYIIKGDVAMYPDGSGVDKTKSSGTIVIMDESGEYKFISPDQIYKVGESIDPQEELQTACSRIDAEQEAVFGVEARPGAEAPAGTAPAPGTEEPQQRRRMEGGNTSGGTLPGEKNDVTSQHGNRPEQDNDGLSPANHGGAVAGDAAGGVEADRDRSDIRVYEEGLASGGNAHSDYSERNRREAESERLVKIARENGQHRERKDILALGTRQTKASGESEVVIDHEQGRVYKIKDPYAKGAMKPGVNPEDAILEHLVHNKYFPETAYRFEGIGDDLGDARIILSQGYVESVGQATQAQIEAALAEKGLTRIDRYHYGNDEIVVTDVTGDNALVGADGKVYFIDPIINFKRPVREIIGEMPEKAPARQEAAGNSTENRESGGKSVSENGVSVGNGQQSALERVPLDGRGKPRFEAVDPDTAWDALVEKTSDEARAQAFADNMVGLSEAALKKAGKRKTKPSADVDEFMEAENGRLAAIERAQATLDHWKSVAGTRQRRETERRRAAEAEARRRAAERAEDEKAEREAREEAERLEREALEGVPEWHMDTPENARKRGMRRYSGRMHTRQEPVQGVIGKEVEVKFSQKDIPAGRVAVIEASELQPSHVQGERNPLFFIDEAQPKNRAESVSANAARKMAEGIRPQEITGSATAYSGAPTVNARGEVIQGNNRSDALRFLWENELPEQQRTYREYLLEHAEQFGIDPEAVKRMRQPVLVNMLDVEDSEAIRLGQMTAQDTESGGIERLKPKNVAQRLGEEMREFANRLLNSGDEEASFGQLVDRNGADVLKWMSRTGAISDTQYQSAFDSKGNLTAEAKNDLQKVLYQAVFKGGSQQLEETFEKLPAKAQRAILSTAFRDMDSPLAGRMLPEIQASVMAYDMLMRDPAFAAAGNMERVLSAIEAFKRTTALDDRLEQYVPADNFSNFALHLAGMYKAADMSQTTIASYFNQMYDLAQGKKAATLFEEADTTAYPLAEVIKKVLNIDYQPAKNGNNNVANGGADVALRNQGSPGGESRGSEPPASREQNPAGAEPTGRGAGAANDSTAGRAAVQNNIPEKKEVTSADPRTMPDDEKARRGDMLRNAEAIPVEKGVIVSSSELSARKVAESWWDANVGAPVFYETEAGEVEISKSSIKDSLSHGYNQAKLDALTSLSEGFRNATYLGTLPDFGRPGVQNHYFAYPIFYEGQRRYVFCRAMATNNKNKLYVHEVFLEEAINKSNTLQTIASASKDGELHGGIALYRAILKNVLDNSLPALETSPATVDGKVQDTAEGGNPLSGNSSLSETSYGRNREIVYDRHTTAKQPAEVAEESQKPTQNGTSDNSRMNSSAQSDGKVNDSASEKQAEGAESSVATARWHGTESEMPATPGLAGWRRWQLFEESVEVFSKRAYNRALEGLSRSFGENADYGELSYEDFAAHYREEVTEAGYKATEAYLPAVFEYLQSRLERALAERREARRGERPQSGRGSDEPGAGHQRDDAPSPVPAQLEAGNYKKEHRRVDGHEISIENSKGSVRHGRDADGTEWETTMQHDYGYIRGTRGVDGDHIDVFLSDRPEEGDVFVIDQVDKDGNFDEHKVMYGFPSEEAAREAYLSNYEPGWSGLGAITHVSKEEFKKWIQSSKRKTKPFAEYKSVKPIEDTSMVGRSLSEQEATDLIARMEANAEVAPAIELTPENWIAQFGEDGTVDTPLGTVKMGANQLLKLYSLKRTEYFGMIHPTLNSPDVIMEKHAPADGAERDSKYLFVKTFIKSDGSRLVHFESVTVKRDGMEVSISSHEAEGKAIKKEMRNSKILHLSESLSLSSERYLTEAPTETEGPDLVPTSDNVSSDGKVNTLSADKQTDGAESSDLYTITPTSYTNKKGKTSDVWLVKFNRELTAEERAAFDTFVRGQLTEGRKTSRGWYDRKQEGYMMRSEEAARQLGEMLGNDEAVADAQPLSREELHEAVAPATPAEKKPAKPKKSPVNRVSLEDVMTDLSTNGETKLSDHAEPVKSEPAPKGRFKVTDEMKAQEEELRRLLGIDDDEGSRDTYFRDPDDLTPEQKRKVFALGVNYAFNFLDNGVTAFPDFAKGVVGRLGAKVKPFIKSWYEGAKRVPGYGGEGYTDTAEVDRFDIENFDKPSPDAIRDAAMRVAERKAKEAAEQAEKELITERNEQRKKDEQQTAADTAALAGEAEAVAGEAEAIAESARDERAVAEASGKVEKALDKINNQLAILGYFERKGEDPVAVAERKAAEAGGDLAARLTDELGLRLTDLPKGVNVAGADFGDNGGYVIINLPVRKGHEPLRIDIRFGRTENGSLRLVELTSTLKRGDAQSYIIGADSKVWLVAPKYGELLETIKEQMGKYLPKEEKFEVPAHWHGKTLAELEEMLADILPKAGSKTGKSFGMDKIARGLSKYIESRKAKEEAPAEASKEKIVNGYKVGDEVMWDRYDNGKWEKVKIEDFDADGSPIFESVKGIMSEKGDWSRVKPADGIFGEAQRVAAKAKADRAQQRREDNQGNPIDGNGKLVVEDVKSVGEITDADFIAPTRNVGLPKLPKNISDAIGLDRRKVVIKKSIFEKNRDTHGELTPQDSRDIFSRALYNPNLTGTTQPIRRPDYKVAIQTGDKNAVVVLDVYAGKDNVEIVGWRKVDAKGLEKMKRQSEREGGQFLILSPNEGSAAALSALPSDVSSTSKVTNKKTKEQIKPEQQVGDLFGGLFDEPENTDNNVKRESDTKGQGVAKSARTHAMGNDAPRTDGGVQPRGAEPTDKSRADDAKRSEMERGTDGTAHGTDEKRELQPRLGDRGRDEGDTDSGSAGSAMERGGTAGEGTVSKRGSDRGGEGLSEGEPATESGRGSGTPAVKKARKPEARYTRNFRYDEQEGNEADSYTPSQRLEANVKAIETLAEVLFGGKAATEGQIAIMSRFRGWGQVDLGKYYDIDHILRSTYPSAPVNRLAKAIQKLDPQGDKKLFDAIKRASLSSYHTPTPIARAMNTFLSLAGYKGGAFLDPSMGNGMYEGTLPKSIQERTAITGVELDWLSGQLSRQLYPDANVIIGGFEKSGIAPGSFDVVTSNVPFGDIVVNDPTWKNDATPLKRSAQNRIHNYYAVKMLEAARPGGLVAMLTTSAVMDTPSNQNIRAHIADQGEILGAIRLPDNTFQGTGVVTDILFIRKWRDDQDRAQRREDASYKELEQAFLSHFEKTAPNKLDGKEEKVQLNGYFEKNPRNLIGEVQAGNQYGKRDAFGLTSNLSVEEIASEIEKAIKRIVGSRRGSLFNPTRTIREAQHAVREAYKGEGDWVSNGNLVIQDGKAGVLTAKKNEYGEVTRMFEAAKAAPSKKELERTEAMIIVRTAMKKLIAGQIEGAKERNLTALRTELQKAYDNFVGKYGRLQDKENSFILDDIDGYTLQALERWKNGKFEGLSDIFTKNSIKPALKLDGKKTPQEAVALSLAEYGYLRPDYLVKALGEDWAEQCGDFVFLKPNSEDDYATRDEYLSGDVVSKLAEARAAAEKDKSFERNVKALEEVQPERIPFDDIAIHLGARWIPENILNDFVNDLFGIHAVYSNRNRRWDPEKKTYINDQKSGVRYIPETDSFEINIEKKELGGAAQDWETPRKTAKEILQAALEDKTLLIKYKDKEGNEHIDEEQTELANQKIADLRERFESWLPSDPERVETLEQTYNDRFNRTVIRHFDGSHLVVPGLMGKELRPHQKDAVWMLINNRGGIVDHIVGAGKTLVMQSAIMEMRRMGIAKKPMIVALKSTVSQIAREFKEAFPSARVLAPNDSDFKKENRKKFIANISLNDYDCIILSHEQYCMLPHTEEAERAVIDEQLWQLNNMIEYLYGTNDTSQMTKKQIKALEKRRNNLTATLEKRLDRNVDREFCFENLGVDYMFVDESHQFKSLPYVTSYQKVAGLGNAQGSSRAVALLTGIRHLQRMHQGDKGTVFLSGTTITNSLVEIYNLLNYLRPRKLEELGMPTFDAWASTFAVHTAELEAGVTGTFAMKDRFRSFDNVPELSQLYAEIADVRNDTNLKLPKPAVDGHTVIVPASDSMQEINAEIVKMLESKDGSFFGIHPKDPNRAPWGLHASTLSAKAAVSPRLIFPDMEDDGGKVGAVCENVRKNYEEMAEQKGVQLIFCEIGVPDKSKKYDAYTDMVNRFVNDYGIPKSEIAYIQQATNEEKRKDLFQRVRDGKVRILIGGTTNMGTGVNVQDRITDMHMLTVPWTPSALEQCIGRGARQGNLVARDFMGNKVRVHYYATEGSLDLYKYQLLDSKGKMFTQLKMGTVNGGRSFDEGSADEDGNIDPAEMVAILSGNPVIYEKAKQEKVVKKLRALRNGFERDYQRKKAKYTELQAREERLARLVRLNERDRYDLAREGFKPDDKGVYPTKFSVMEGYSRYGGRTFDKPKEGGEYLLKMLEDGKDVTLQGFGQRAKIVTVNEEGAGGLFSSYRVLQTGDGERDIKYTVRLSDDATAAGTAFRNLLKRIIDNGEVFKRDLDETKRQLAGMNIGDGVFPRQAELDEAVAKLKELNAEYNRLGRRSGGEEGPTDGDGNKYRLVEDSAVLDFLDGQPLKLGYRYSQWANMGVLPPMTAKQNGEWRAPMVFSRWEQSEEGMRKENGKADLVQGNGRTTGDVAYNPYFHIRTSPLNDQFTAAYDRPELIVVEGYYPESEETSGYRAEGAKDSVGLMDWHSGSVNGQLSDETKVQTMLSRYFKPGRIVPWSEVADLIMERVGNQKITFPINAVPPMLRAELAKRGARFGDISGSVAEADIPMLNDLRDRVNAGEWDAGLEKAREYIDAYESSPEAKEARVANLSALSHTPVRVIRTQAEVDALPTRRERRAKGWFDSATGEVVIVLPNNVNVADVDNTFVHEVAGHKGLRAFIGEERFDEFLGEVYNYASNPIRKVIDQKTDDMVNAEADRIFRGKQAAHDNVAEANAKYFADMAEARVEAEAKREEFRKEATEEYMSDLGGRIGSEGFEKMSRDELTLWGKIKAKVQSFLDKFLRGLKIAKSIRLSDKDLAYILYKSWKNLRDKQGKGGVFAEAEDAVMRMRTGWDDANEAKQTGRSEAALKHLEPSSTGEYAAKISQKIETAKKRLHELSEQYRGVTNTRGFLTDLGDALGLIRNANSSGYRAFELKDGRTMVVRISNHNANSANSDGRPVVSIVLKSKRSGNTFVASEGRTVDEYVYMKEDIRNVPGDTLSMIADSVAELLDTGIYTDRTGLAHENHSPDDSGELRFRDGDPGLEEYITRMKTEAMQANADNLQAKRDAMRAIGGNLNHLRQAMARQREYDITTVKSVTDLARILMDAGLLDDLSKFETKRILGAVSNVVGKQDVSGYVRRVLDIMVDNQLRNTERAFGKLISMRTSRADGRGINVQGALDPDGEAILKIFNAWKGLGVKEINGRIADATDSMSDAYAPIAERATLEYAGLLIARDYAENVAESKKSEKMFREEIRKAREEKEAGRMTAEAYKQTERAIRAAIQQMKLDRISAYESLMEKLGGELKESVDRAKAWREAEKERVNAIHHLANSDMQGRELRGDLEDTRLMKLRNHWLVNWLLEPMSTLDQMLKMFGSKNPNGEGYLQNYFMRGWTDAADREQEMKEAVHRQMDDKAAEIFGKRRTWHNGGTRKVDYTYSDLYDYAKAQPGATIEYYDGAEMREYEIEQGKLLYLYAVDKMPMGRATNRRMGIDDVTMQRITDALDPKLKAYADWVQDELLPRMGDSANEVHKKMFGAAMDAIDNYFPFVRDKNGLKREVENGQDTRRNDRISVQTGAIKKRVASVAKWDMRKCDFMDVLAKHVDEICHWTAFAELNRDFGTLLSYNRLKQQVFRMNSVYGSGEQLWERFEECAAIATDAYEPLRSKFDRVLVQGAKGVAMGKISFRAFPALKQTLSLPAFFGEVNMKYVAADLGTGGVKACQWAWRNMPNYRKRILSRTSGDYRLKENEYDGKIMKAASYGMLPNIGVDAWTIAIGSHGIYQTRKAKYLRWGMEESLAERRARQDAELCYNKSQQSSEGPFMAPVQVDHTFYATSAMLFRNSSTAYTREAYTSARNLKRLISGEVDEEYVAKQILRTLHPEAEGAWTDAEWANARKNARKEIRSAYVKNTVNLAMFGWILPWLWRIGGIAPLLLLSGDEEEKQKQWEDAALRSRFAPAEGLAYGDVIAEGLNYMFPKVPDKKLYQIGRENPIYTDIKDALEKADKDMLAAANDVINIIGGMAFGVNPQTLTDAVVAVMDYCGDDAQTSRECALLMARVLNCPQSQLDKLYFEELDASGEEASRMTPSEIAERYARYKIRRGAPLTGWAYGSEEREEIMEKYRKRSNTIAKERLTRDTDRAVTDSLTAWNEEYEATQQRVSEIKKVKESDVDRYYDLLDELEGTPEFDRYQIIKGYKSEVEALTKEWLRATTPERRDSCTQALINLKRRMATELRDTAQ